MDGRLAFFIVTIIVFPICVYSSLAGSAKKDDASQKLETTLKYIDELDSALKATDNVIEGKEKKDALLNNQPTEDHKDVSSLACPELVKRFSSGPNVQHYYSCSKAGDAPVLEKCKEGEVYWAKEGLCIARDTSNGENDPNTLNDPSLGEPLSDSAGNKGSDLKTYSEPVLGRAVHLGCLFDAKRNLIMTSDSFWTPATIEKNKIVTNSIASDVSFFAAQTTFERLSRMDITASMALEFMGGLIKVSGSAAFLRDKVESTNTVAFVMRSQYDTRDEILPTAVPKDFVDVCKLKDPTHVVTSIHYGMDAYFTFKRTAKSQESKEKISGRLQAAVKSIPGASIEGQASVDLEGSVKEKVKDIDVKLRGDFILPVQPTTYEESIVVFKKLTSHLGAAPEYKNAKEMIMTLTPISRFCDKSAAILIGISETLIQGATTMLDELDRTMLSAQTLAKTDAVRKYIPLQNIINAFVSKLNSFVLKLKSDLQTVLPKIRGGGEGSGEKDLVALIDRYTKSPFYFPKSKSFLKVRRRELETIDKILNWKDFQKNNIVVTDYEDANDNKLLLTKPLLVLVQFNVLSDMTIINRFLNNDANLDESNAWFNSKKVISNMGKTLNALTKFASVNKGGDCGYLFKTSEIKNDTVTVYAQKDGDSFTNDFTFPEEPSKITNVRNKYNAIVFELESVTNKWIEQVEMRYWKLAREDEAITKMFEFKNGRKYEIDELDPNEVYFYTIRYVTVMGKSPPGPQDSILTRPCSPPTNIRLTSVTATSFTMLWDRPLHIGDGVQIAKYVVSVIFGTQYVFVKSKKTWQQAEQYCINWKGHLVTITSKETNDYLISEMERRRMSNSWIGYTDVAKEGSWEWADSATYNTFRNWAPGKPTVGNTVNCAAVSSGSYKGKWYNTGCSRKLQFICGRRNPKGDQALRQVTLKGSEQMFTFKDLSVATRYSIHILAKADNKKYNESGKIQEIASKSEKGWISTLTKPDAPEQPTTVTITSSSIKITYRPPERIATGAVIQEYKVKYSLLNNKGDQVAPGQTKLQSAKKSRTVTIARLVQGSTYSFSVMVITNLGASTWSPALIAKTAFKQTELDVLKSSVTQQIETRVASATYEMDSNIQVAKKQIEEMKEIVSLANVFYPQGTKQYVAQGLYSDYDGARFIGYGYHGTNADGAPKTDVSFLECLAYCVKERKTKGVTWNGFYYAWGSKYCVFLKQDTGHVQAKGFLHYRFSNEAKKQPGVEYLMPESNGTPMKKNYAQAEAYCEGLRGNLATITSYYVNTYVWNLINKKSQSRAYIGINDIDKENSFTWKDGTTYNTYIRWGNGQPDNAGNNEDCGEMLGQNWNDVPCSMVSSFVCQRKLSITAGPNIGITDWGTWTAYMTCPAQKHVIGFRIRVEAQLAGSGDDSALNGIQLSCQGGTESDKKAGYWGAWSSWKKCKNSGYIIALDLKGMLTNGDSDDYGATDLKAKCSGGDELIGGGLPNGVWAGYRSCPQHTYFCGLKTKVQAPIGAGDDTALNRIQLGCCLVNQVSLVLSVFEDKTLLTDDHLVATLPTLGKNYDILFEVYAEKFVSRWMNIIHVTTGKNSGEQGSRIPGIWFQPNPKSPNKKKLHVCNSLSGNARHCKVSSEYFPLGKWIKVRQTQQLEGSKYMYTLYFDDVQFFKGENTRPTAFKNVKVYAKDPWYSSASWEGYIRNLRISDDTAEPTFTM